MPRRGATTADDTAIADRRQKVAEMYLARRTQQEIAAAVGVDQATVSRDLTAVRKEWLASAVRDVGERKAEELARIDALELIALEAWKRSCKDAETLHAGTTKGRTTKAGDPLPDLTKTYKTVKGQTGDPRFLERVSWCIDRRCQLLGLDPPKKVAPTDPSGDNEYTGGLTHEERLARVLAVLEQARTGRPAEDTARGGAGGTGPEPGGSGGPGVAPAPGPADAGISQPGR